MPTIDEYWTKRSEQLEERWNKEAKKLDARLKASYRRAFQEVNRDLRVYLTRKGFDYNELMMSLDSVERNERKMSLIEFLANLKDLDSNIAKRIAQDVNVHLDMKKLTRLDAISSEMLVKLGEKALDEDKEIREQMSKVYTQTLLLDKYEFMRMKINTPTYRINEKLIEDILTYPWSGDNFSNRIWDNKQKLIKVLRQELTQGVIQGLHADDVADRLKDKMNVSLRDAITLVHTETAYFYGKGTLDSYEEAQIEGYKLHVTYDRRTSPICRSLDASKVYRRDEASVGVNYPPLHIRCRTLAIPNFEGLSGPKYRWVRDNKDKSVKVEEASMSYEKYEKQFLDKPKEEKKTSENPNDRFVKVEYRN
ncbi:phage head morphogenesis protein [Bacillus anthracis]|nr:phage head morphogenesis protein [Bacillus anthracis]